MLWCHLSLSLSLSLQIDALMAGYAKFGTGWHAILDYSKRKFDSVRTAVDLKDKWRNLEKSGYLDQFAAAAGKKRKGG